MNKSNKTKFTIITPCYNSDKFIRETVTSVLLNTDVRNGKISLEYIVYDGGSSDKTIKIVEKIFSEINQDNIATLLFSEKDKSMYDALSKGLQKASGDIISYINAGDFYSPHAFGIVSNLFTSHRIKWLTGMDVVYNEKSQIISSNLPFRYKKRLIKTGLYNLKVLPHIQQESTFWASNLNDIVDYNRLKEFKSAGDYYLWKCFSEIEDLYIVEAWLGGFKVHRNQLSCNSTLYSNEMAKIAIAPKPQDFINAYIEKLLWNTPNSWKKKINKKTLLHFDHGTQEYVI